VADRLEDLYTELHEPIYRFLAALTGDPDVAEELTQETFLQAILSLPRFRRESSLTTWLYAIARNQYRKRVARESRKPPLEPPAIPCGPPDEVAERQEERRRLFRALAALPEAHREAQEFFGRPVVTLRLVDPRYYHLDTAMFALGGDNVAYYPEAFSPGSRAVLERMFPDAVIASAEDAAVLGLNAVCDGRHVVLNAEASGLALELKRRGYDVIPVDLSELRKAGGGPKCCTLEIRS